MSPIGTPEAMNNPTTMAPANTSNRTQPVPKDGPSSSGAKRRHATSNVVGLDIYNSQNDDIGKVQDIAFDASKRVTGYILSVGGFSAWARVMSRSIQIAVWWLTTRRTTSRRRT
jgi:sporulation protein YlmC with PRC-barrel domain